MKKIIQKFMSLVACTAFVTSLSTRAYADSYVVEENEEYGISVYGTDTHTIIKLPTPDVTNGYK